MPYRSTPENRHFGVSFTSVGGVEAEISCNVPEHTKKTANHIVQEDLLAIKYSTSDIKIIII